MIRPILNYSSSIFSSLFLNGRILMVHNQKIHFLADSVQNLSKNSDQLALAMMPMDQVIYATSCFRKLRFDQFNFNMISWCKMVCGCKEQTMALLLCNPSNELVEWGRRKQICFKNIHIIVDQPRTMIN